MKSIKKTTVVCTASLLTLSLLSACAGKTDSGTGAAADPASAKPTEINIMTTFFSPEPPDANNSILKEIEKKQIQVLRSVGFPPTIMKKR